MAIPTIEQVEESGANMDTITEEVKSQANTLVDQYGDTRTTMRGREVASQEAIDNFNLAGDSAIDAIQNRSDQQFTDINNTFQAQFAYKRIGNISDYVGQTLQDADRLNSYAFPDNSGEWYGPIQSQTFPITIPADPAVDSGWALVSATTELSALARSLNVKDSQVIYHDDTNTVLDDVLYIYDKSANQKTWKLPALDSAGKTIASVIGEQLTTSGGTGRDIYDLEGASVSTYVIRLSDFGADRTGAVDSTDAINNAIQALKDTISQPVVGILASLTAKLDFEGGLYLCEGSINATSIQSMGWELAGNGAVIVSSATGKTALDLADSRWGTISQLTVTARDEDDVLQGIQIGRDVTGRPAGSLVFDNVTITGYWTRTSMYNYASEVDMHESPTYINYEDSLSSYVMIVDGIHEWGIVSDFVTPAPLKTIASNIQHTFVGGSFRKLTSGPVVWMTRTSQFKLINHYTTCLDNYAYIIADDGSGFADLNFDTHIEADGLLGCFAFTLAADPIVVVDKVIVKDFHYRDHAPQANLRVFFASGELNVKLIGSIDIARYQSVPANGLCQPAAKFELVGKINLPNLDSNNTVKTYGTLTPNIHLPVTGVIGGAPEIITSETNEERIFKGRVTFTSKESDNINIASFEALRNVVHEDGSTKMTLLGTEPSFGGVEGVIAIDSGANWSGVSAGTSSLVIYLNGQWNKIV